MFPLRRELRASLEIRAMPITRFLVVSLSTGLAAWFGWTLGRPMGILAGFLIANVGFATGWYLGRSFVRNNFD